jgi:phenylacetate-CoA ligase
MLIIRGINVFPSQVEYSLMTNPEVGNEFQIIVERTGALDDMTVKVELKPEAFTDNMAGIEKVRARVEHNLRSTLNIHANVELVEPGALPRFEGKAKRVIDKRKL